MKRLLMISSFLAIAAISSKSYAWGDDKKSETKKTVSTNNALTGTKKDITETKKVVEDKAGNVKKEVKKDVEETKRATENRAGEIKRETKTVIEDTKEAVKKRM